MAAFLFFAFFLSLDLSSKVETISNYSQQLLLICWSIGCDRAPVSVFVSTLSELAVKT